MAACCFAVFAASACLSNGCGCSPNGSGGGSFFGGKSGGRGGGALNVHPCGGGVQLSHSSWVHHLPSHYVIQVSCHRCHRGITPQPRGRGAPQKKNEARAVLESNWLRTMTMMIDDIHQYTVPHPMNPSPFCRRWLAFFSSPFCRRWLALLPLGFLTGNPALS